MLGDSPSGVRPVYCLYRAGDWPIVCYRVVSQRPAQVGDFLSFADLGTTFEWWDFPRAVGVSCWTDLARAGALALKKGMAFVAELNLQHADPRLPWAQTGHRDHVTLWGPPPLLLQAVVTYVDT